MEKVRSSDGTEIAFDRSGDGPPAILVAGAFNDSSTLSPLAAVLASDVTALTYDRRGRGASGDTAPYALEREVEDLAALIDEVGGSASLFGYSSGALLCLQAAARGLAVDRLTLYDAPLPADDQARARLREIERRLAELVDGGRRGEAVELFQARVVGIPDEVVAKLRHAPFRPGLEAIAHTLAYDVNLVHNAPTPAQLAAIGVPTLVLDGAQSAPPLRHAAHAIAEALPDARHDTLEGQSHDIDPSAVAPRLVEFIAGAPRASPGPART